MAENSGIYSQFAKHFSSREEAEAYKEEARRRTEELTKDWVEVSKRVRVPPEQAEEALRLYHSPSPTPTAVKPSVTPSQIIERKRDFSTIRQGRSTNALTKIRATEGKNATVDTITGDATIKRGNFSLTIPNYRELTGLKTSTYQL